MAELKKNIGFFTIFALLVTSLIGTGLFLAPAVAARYAGGASIIAWIFMFVISVYIAACFGELVARYPNAGGVYEFSKKAYGRFFSFMIGWTTWLTNTINTPLLIVAALKISFPAMANINMILLSIGIIVFLNFVAFKGMKDSSILLIIFAIITLLVIGIFIYEGMGAETFNANNVFDFENSSFWLIFVAIFFISETFFGWESATFLAEETNNARKIIPKALIITTLIVGGLSVIVAFISLGLVPLETLIGSNNSLMLILNNIFNPKTIKYFTYAIFVVFIGSASGNIISSPRLLLAMSRDKLFIEQFSHIHPKTKTPYKGIIFQAIVAILLILISTGNYKQLLSLIIPLSFLMYFGVILTVPILRKKMKSKSSFQAPLGNILPYFLAILFLVFIVIWLSVEPNAAYLFRYALGFLFFGLPVYLLLNVYYNPDFAIEINEFFSYINLFLENIIFPKNLRKAILNIFTKYKNKKILEFGSGIGSLTTLLADKVGSKGKIYAVDFSEKNLKILNKRMVKLNHFHVETIHDKHVISRVHPKIKEVDMVFSVGLLSYIQNLNKILEELYDILPEGGKICFIEYMDYFHFIPNPKYLTKKKEIQQVFRQCGFSVRIKKIKGVLWNYSLIYGMKTEHANNPFI